MYRQMILQSVRFLQFCRQASDYPGTRLDTLTHQDDQGHFSSDQNSQRGSRGGGSGGRGQHRPRERRLLPFERICVPNANLDQLLAYCTISAWANAFTEECGLARNAVAGASLGDEFPGGRGRTLSLRWVCAHMIEEYAGTAAMLTCYCSARRDDRLLTHGLVRWPRTFTGSADTGRWMLAHSILW
jgi:hypothetical protein